MRASRIFALLFMRAAGISLPGRLDFPTTLNGSEAMAAWFESVGSVAAACTTLCWLPQAVKILREKRTEGISMVTQSVFTLGIALWAAYGFLLNNRPLIYANVVTLVFALAILILKIRYNEPVKK
jgi:MtN3 and saliva related transmembrane protein